MYIQSCVEVLKTSIQTTWRLTTSQETRTPPRTCTWHVHMHLNIFNIHMQAYRAYICRHSVHTYAGILCIHMQAYCACICRHIVHTYAGILCIHMQAYYEYPSKLSAVWRRDRRGDERKTRVWRESVSICVCIYVYVCVCVCVCVCMYTRAEVACVCSANNRTCVYTCRSCIHTYTRTYIQRHTHTYMYVHTYMIILHTNTQIINTYM